jgi:hypothetical protein
MHSLDLTQRNIDDIAELFPAVITEARDEDGNLIRVIDFDLLRQELSDHLIEGSQERYQLARQARSIVRRERADRQDPPPRARGVSQL